MVFAYFLYTIRARGYHLELETRGNVMHCERNHPAGVTDCEAVSGLMVLGAGSPLGLPPLCVCVSGEERDWKGVAVCLLK